MSNHYTPTFSSIRRSSRMRRLPDDTCRLFYMLLLPQLDAWGRAPGLPEALLAEVWPLLGKSVEETERVLRACREVGLVDLHERDGEFWIVLPDWEQKAGTVGRISHRKASQWPDPVPESLVSVHPVETVEPGEAGGSGQSRAERAEPGGDGRTRADRANPGGPRVRAGGRAGARSEPQPQPQPQPHSGSTTRRGEDHPPGAPPGGDGQSDPPPKPLTPQQELVEWFCAKFQESRGAPYVYLALDFSKTATLLGRPGVTPEEWRTRALRMLTSSTQFHFEKASPRHLADRWNEFAVEIRPLSPGQRRQLEADRFFDEFERRQAQGVVSESA